MTAAQLRVQKGKDSASNQLASARSRTEGLFGADTDEGRGAAAAPGARPPLTPPLQICRSCRSVQR